MTAGQIIALFNVLKMFIDLEGEIFCKDEI